MRFSAVLPFAAAALALGIETPGDSAIAARLSGNANVRREDGPAPPPAAAPPSVAPPAAGAYTVITTVPRRSQGPCKFAIDVLPTKDAPAAIVCRAEGNNILNGFTRGMAGLLAARLAAEYDPNCVLTENTAYHVGGDPGATFAIFKRDDNTDSKGKLLKQRPETFFLDCGAVFSTQPVSGPSGTATAPQVKMIRDSRGLIPLMSEWFPKEFFASQKSGDFSDDAPPPWAMACLASAFLIPLPKEDNKEDEVSESSNPEGGEAAMQPAEESGIAAIETEEHESKQATI